MSNNRRSHSAAFKAKVALAAIKEELTQAQITSRYEIHTTQVRQWKNQALSAIESGFSRKRERDKKNQTEQMANLYEQIGRLQMQPDWLKKNQGLATSEKRQRIDPTHPKLTVAEQCEWFGLSRSSYYYQAKRRDDDKEAIMRLIDEHYLEYPHEGSRKVSKMLKNKGYPVGRYRTLTVMKEMGIEPIYPKPNTSAPNKAHEVYPYLLRDVDIERPNHVWSSDITYVPLRGGHVYLMAIIDWYSRYVIDWELSITLEAEFCVRALKRALSNNRCDIFNTDQRSQFTSQAWVNTLKSKHISISMDGRGRCLDNVFVEQLWRSVKQECIYRYQFESVKQLKEGLIRYFDYYNNKRLHQSLDYRTPADVYFSVA